MIQVPPLSEIIATPDSQPVIKESSVNDSNDTDQNDPNTVVISKLEKRLRELRRNLVKTQTNLSTLELKLHDKNKLITNKNNTLKELNNKLEKLQTDDNTQEHSIDSPKEKIVKNAGSAATKNESLAASILPDIERMSYLSKDTHKKIKLVAASYFKSLSNKDLAYMTVALLLGLVLIRYRKKLYSYVAISYDYPKYYSNKKEKEVKLTQQQIKALDKDIISFQKTLINDDLKNDQQIEVCEAFLHECEDLAHELYDTPEHDEISSDKVSNITNPLTTEKETECDTTLELATDDKVIKDKEENTRSKLEEITLDLLENLEEETQPTETQEAHEETTSESSKLDWKKLLIEADKQLAKGNYKEVPGAADMLNSAHDKDTDNKENNSNTITVEESKPKDIPVTFRNSSFEEIEMPVFDIVKHPENTQPEIKIDKFSDAIIDEILNYDEYCRNQSVLREDGGLLPA